jgi:hypothetical protein
MVVVGLAGLLALHVFMLAGHGRQHDPPAGMPAMQAAAASARLPWRSVPMVGGVAGAGVDMAVACLAVLAGLGWLRPRATGQTAAVWPDRRAATHHPARQQPGGRRPPSLEELCISLT